MACYQIYIQAEMDLIAEIGSELDKIEDMNNQQFDLEEHNNLDAFDDFMMMVIH